MSEVLDDLQHNAKAGQALAHPLARALRDSGMDLHCASGYMVRLNAFGQVGFANGEANVKRLDELRTIRESILDSASRGLSSVSMNNEMLKKIIKHGATDLHQVDNMTRLNTDIKTKIAKEWSHKDYFHFGQVSKLADIDRQEMIDIISGADMMAPALFDSWERIDHVAAIRSGEPPSMQDGYSEPDAGTFAMEPAKIEAALEGRAKALMERFGLGNIRISGTPSMEQCAATLDTLDYSLAEIARGAGIPEKSIGLGGDFCIHVNADVGRASGYCSYEPPHGVGSICLSPDNGWKTLAHEWFHAFDNTLPHVSQTPGYASMEIAEHMATSGTLAKITKGMASAAQMSEEDWRSERAAAYAGGRSSHEILAQLGRSSHAVISGVRSMPGVDALEEVSREETEASIARIHDGLFERFYKSRVEAGLEAQALTRFTALCRNLLEGKAELSDVASWRKEHLGDNAAMCQHYDAFVMAERAARDSRVAAKMDDSTQESTMERFAKIADKHLGEATGGDDWSGYSSSPAEMSARGFEGNCFLDTPEAKRAHLVDGRDNSMYWPVAGERGAHREKYRAYLSHGIMAMIDSGRLGKEILKGFSPKDESAISATAAPTPLAVSAKLAARREVASSQTQSPIELGQGGHRQGQVVSDGIGLTCQRPASKMNR